MNLTREHFDSAGYLETMDEVAMLLFVTQELRKMSVSFAKSPEIDKRDADGPASNILRTIKAVAKGLMAALFEKSAKRGPMLLAARKRGFKKLIVAIEQAQILADMERKAFVGTGVRGDTIQIQVVGRLEQIVAAWRPLVG